MKRNIKDFLFIALIAASTASCNDFLDINPPTEIVPEDYYKSEEQIQAVTNDFYEMLPSHGNGTWDYGIFDNDNGTDNQAGNSADGKYALGQWKTGMGNGNWSFGTIRNLNYHLSTILENYENGVISGSDAKIRHYIGELYFFRAYNYFSLLRSWGDFPIVKEVLPDDETTLVAANKRMPRNEVARFILEDLDTAISYMSDIDQHRNRLSPDVAKLIKSRVALFEGSWLYNFKGTAFVPNGEGWAGKEKDYNANYEFPTGSIDKEAEYFFSIAASSAQELAEKYIGKLSVNTGLVPQSESDPTNPYMDLFGSYDLSGYPEVLLWREYNNGLNIVHCVEIGVQMVNLGVGLTRSMVESFIMSDGKPIYASHDGFSYDDTTIGNVRKNADPRLHVFLKEPGQKNLFKNMEAQTILANPVEGYPNLLGAADRCATTGYVIRKGGTFDKANTDNGRCTTASIAFRVTEAFLNYIEAQYMLTKDINSGNILKYWKAVREAAGFTGEATDPRVTIAATDMNKEKLDWGAYTGGELLTDATLYNIRRERRCEFMAEGMRWMDLIRWRALDQMIDNPYHVEGFHLWNTPMQQWYDENALVSDGSASAIVSSPELSEYLRPFERNMTGNNLFRNGFTWRMAHYLQPMPIKQMMLTAPDYNTVESSPLYQNPGWPLTPNTAAEY